MKMVVLASLLAVAGVAPIAQTCFALQPASTEQAAAQGQGGNIQMSADEYKAWNDAKSAATPAAQAAGYEAYLKAYPNSAVKAAALGDMLFAYSQGSDNAKTLDAADRLLQVDPNNVQALTLEVYMRKNDADKLTDDAAKQAALDKVAAYAQTGLNAPKPKEASDADWAALKKTSTQIFQSAIVDDDLAKKDNASAIAVLKAEVTADEPDTHASGPWLFDVWILAQAYYTSNPPDYLNCAWYSTRAIAFAPDAFKTQWQPIASYCYSRYHGGKDGYEKLQALVQTSLNPPADLATTITPAPKPEDIVAKLIAETPDLASLAISDKEQIFQYGKQEDADKVFATIKSKSATFPDVIVIAATADQLQVAVTENAVQTKTADFTFAMKAPLTKVPAVGDKVTVEGTYASYTKAPVMISMSDGNVIEKKAPAKAPVHHAPVKRTH